MKAIAAMDSNRVIGYKGSIPWHYPKDMAFFRQMTGVQDLFMGRSTFESLGKPLPDRFTYILTSTPSKYRNTANPPCTYITGVELTRWLYEFPVRMEKTWLCGGATVYKQFLPLCTELYVTHIADEYEGDTYMPEFESLFPYSSIVMETKDFIIAKYTKENIPVGWRLLTKSEALQPGDRYDSEGLWFPVELMTPADVARVPKIIRYSKV